MTLDSLPWGYRALVYGAGGGLGSALVRTLLTDPRCGVVFAGSRRPLPPVDAHTERPSSNKRRDFFFDLEDEASIETSAASSSIEGPLHLVLVATGRLHRPEKTWRAITADALRESFAINSIGPALIAKHLLGRLATGDKAVLAMLSARVGSISDNRLGGWHAYRASKAALNMLVRTVSVELAARNKSAVCVSLHPGTVDTPLSKPFQSHVDPQRLFSPDTSAQHLLRVVNGLEPCQSGRLWAWDGTEIPF